MELVYSLTPTTDFSLWSLTSFETPTAALRLGTTVLDTVYQKYINESELLTKAFVFGILVAKWSTHRDVKLTYSAHTGQIFHKS